MIHVLRVIPSPRNAYRAHTVNVFVLALMYNGRICIDRGASRRVLQRKLVFCSNDNSLGFPA